MLRSLLLGMLLTSEAFALTEVPDHQIPSVAYTFSPSSAEVIAMVRHGNRIYVGGNFNRIGAIVRRNLAAIDASTGQVDLAWDPNADGVVTGMAASQDRLFVAGVFSTVHGVSTRALAAVELANTSNTGRVDPNWHDLPMLGQFETVFIHGSRLYVGGNFAYGGGNSQQNNLVAFELNPDGTPGNQDTVWRPDLGGYPAVNGYPKGMVVLGSHLYAGGGATLKAFALADGVSTGTADSAWDPLAGQPNPKNITALAADGQHIYAGGSFSIDGHANLVAIEPANGSNTGEIDTAWAPAPNSSVVCMVFDGTQLIAGGGFSQVQTSTENQSLAAFAPADGVATGEPLPWKPRVETLPSPAPHIGMVKCMGRSGFGLLLGGHFTHVGGEEHGNLAGLGTILKNATQRRWVDVE